MFYTSRRFCASSIRIVITNRWPCLSCLYIRTSDPFNDDDDEEEENKRLTIAVSSSYIDEWKHVSSDRLTLPTKKNWSDVGVGSCCWHCQKKKENLRYIDELSSWRANEWEDAHLLFRCCRVGKKSCWQDRRRSCSEKRDDARKKKKKERKKRRKKKRTREKETYIPFSSTN